MKAESVARQVWSEGIPADLVIGADTIVVLGNRILEKPSNESEAVQMLTELAAGGSTHEG